MNLWLICDGITKKPLSAAISPEAVEQYCCAIGRSYRHELDFYINGGGNISVTRGERMLFEVMLMTCDEAVTSIEDWGEGEKLPGKSVSELPMKAKRGVLPRKQEG